MGTTERKAVRSHLRLLWLHLLKSAYQPHGCERYGASWQASRSDTRAFVQTPLEDSPSLRPEWPSLAEAAYPLGAATGRERDRSSPGGLP